MTRFVIGPCTVRSLASSEDPVHGAWEVTDGEGRPVAQVTVQPVRTDDGPASELRWQVRPGALALDASFLRGFVDRLFGAPTLSTLVAVVACDDRPGADALRAAGLAYAGRLDTPEGPLRRYVLERSAWDRRAVRRAWSVAIFARHEGRVLLVKHKRLGTWLPVGGEVEAGETPLEAARRELFEETGLEGLFPRADPLDGAPAGLLGYEEHLAGKKGLHLNVSFVADVETREVALDESLAGHVWASLEEGPWAEAPPNVRQLAARALAAPSSRP